jgi:hypothetical protein
MFNVQRQRPTSGLYRKNVRACGKRLELAGSVWVAGKRARVPGCKYWKMCYGSTNGRYYGGTTVKGDIRNVYSKGLERWSAWTDSEPRELDFNSHTSGQTVWENLMEEVSAILPTRYSVTGPDDH